MRMQQLSISVSASLTCRPVLLPATLAWLSTCSLTLLTSCRPVSRSNRGCGDAAVMCSSTMHAESVLGIFGFRALSTHAPRSRVRRPFVQLAKRERQFPPAWPCHWLGHGHDQGLGSDAQSDTARSAPRTSMKLRGGVAWQSNAQVVPRVELLRGRDCGHVRSADQARTILRLECTPAYSRPSSQAHSICTYTKQAPLNKMLRSYGCDAEFVVNIWVRPGHAAFLAAALLAILPTGPVDAVYLKNKHGEVFVDSLMISKHSEKVKHEVDFHSPRPVVAVKDDISKKTLLDVVDFVEDMALYEEEAIGDAGLNWAHRQIVNDRMVCDLLAAAHVLEMDSLAAAVMTMKPTWEEVSALEERVSTNEYLLAIRNCQPMVQLLGYADTAEQKAIAEAVPTAIVFAATDPVNKVHNGKWQGDANVLQWATAQSKTEIQEMLLSVPSEDVQQEEYWTRHGGRSSRRSQPACACRIM